MDNFKESVSGFLNPKIKLNKLIKTIWLPFGIHIWLGNQSRTLLTKLIETRNQNSYTYSVWYNEKVSSNRNTST